MIKGLRPRPPDYGRSLKLVGALSVLGSLQLGLLLPSLWAHVQRIAAVAAASAGGRVVPPSSGLSGLASAPPVLLQLYAIAAFSAGAFVSRPLCSWLAACMPLCFVALALATIGVAAGVGHATAHTQGASAALVLVAAQLGVGIATGMGSLASLYVERATPQHAPAPRLPMHTAAGIAGGVLGPLLGLILAWLVEDGGGGASQPSRTELDVELSVPGWMLAGWFALLGVLCPVLLLEPPPPACARPSTSAPEVCGWVLSFAVYFGLALAFSVTLASLVPLLPILTDALFGWDGKPLATLLALLGLTAFVGHLATQAAIRGGVGTPAGMSAVALALLVAHQLAIIPLLAAEAPDIFGSPGALGAWAALCYLAYAVLHEASVRAAYASVDGENPRFLVGVLGSLDALGAMLGALLVASDLSPDLAPVRSAGAGGLLSTPDRERLTVAVVVRSRQLLALPTLLLLAALMLRQGWCTCARRRPRCE